MKTLCKYIRSFYKIKLVSLMCIITKHVPTCNVVPLGAAVLLDFIMVSIKLRYYLNVIIRIISVLNLVGVFVLYSSYVYFLLVFYSFY